MIHTLTTIGRRKLNSDNKSEHPYGTLAGGRKVGKKTQGPSRALFANPIQLADGVAEDQEVGELPLFPDQ